MGGSLSELSLAEDYAKVLVLAEASRWTMRLDGLTVSVVVSSSADPSELYKAILRWVEYPGQVPSLKFADMDSGRTDLPRAWPIVRGFRPSSLDACVSWCAEGFALHPEWRADPRYRWSPHGNPLLRVLRTLQDEIDTFYGGRFRG